IRDRMLTQALQDAYRGLLMTGRHAVGFLFLDLPPDHLDVNVHPTKAEVRFRDPERLQAFITETIPARLHAQDLTGPRRSRRAAHPKSAAPSPEPTFAFALPEAPAPPAPPTPPDLLPPRPVAPTPPRASPPVRGTERYTTSPRQVPPPAVVVP